jgi:photosystem II stability/assembly factor-like uncharacterized protein
LFLLTVFIISGCSISLKTKGGGGNDGGLFVSANKGATWKQDVLMPSIGGTPNNIGFVSANVLALDPSDSNAIYLGTSDYGLYYTYNLASGWQKAKLSDVTINDVIIDPNDKCNIYVALTNKIMQSTDCNRSYNQIYFDSNTGVSITAVAVDHYNSQLVYIGTSRGDLIKSYDRGKSWTPVYRLNEGIKEIVLNPKDSRQAFVATEKTSLFKFSFGSDSPQNLFNPANIVDFSNNIKALNIGDAFRTLTINLDGSIFLATSRVILKSEDGGNNWEKLKIITPENEAAINTLAVNPKNPKEIYYATNTTFFRTSDGGGAWSTISMPSTRAASALVVDFDNPNNVFLGVKKIKN